MSFAIRKSLQSKHSVKTPPGPGPPGLVVFGHPGRRNGFQLRLFAAVAVSAQRQL